MLNHSRRATVPRSHLEARLVHSVQLERHVGAVLQSQAPQLNVLAGCDVDHAHLGTVRLHGVCVEPHLLCGDDAVRHAQPHHEAARRALETREHADPFEPHVDVAGVDLIELGLPLADGLGVLINVGECGRAVLRELVLLELITRRGAFDRVRRQIRGSRASGARVQANRRRRGERPHRGRERRRRKGGGRAQSEERAEDVKREHLGRRQRGSDTFCTSQSPL